jgi:hypothetical protein
VKLGWITWLGTDVRTSEGLLNITMKGIEEAEKMERPILQRWPSDHPVAFGTLMSLLSGIVILCLQTVVKFYTAAP